MRYAKNKKYIKMGHFLLRIRPPLTALDIEGLIPIPGEILSNKKPKWGQPLKRTTILAFWPWDKIFSLPDKPYEMKSVSKKFESNVEVRERKHKSLPRHNTVFVLKFSFHLLFSLPLVLYLSVLLFFLQRVLSASTFLQPTALINLLNLTN